MKNLIASLSLIGFLNGSMALAHNNDNTNLDLIGAIHAEILMAKTINETAMRQNRWEVRDELDRFHKHMVSILQSTNSNNQSIIAFIDEALAIVGDVSPSSWNSIHMSR